MNVDVGSIKRSDLQGSEQRQAVGILILSCSAAAD